MPPLLWNARARYTRLLVQEVRNAAACLNAAQAAICKETGLNPAQWRALAAINRSTFVLSISDLARRLRLSRQSMHPLALGLERAGWIRFLPNQDDRRLLQIEITALGKSQLGAAEARFSMWLLMMTYDLSEHEVGQLANRVRAVRERIARARDYA